MLSWQTNKVSNRPMNFTRQLQNHWDILMRPNIKNDVSIKKIPLTNHHHCSWKWLFWCGPISNQHVSIIPIIIFPITSRWVWCWAVDGCAHPHGPSPWVIPVNLRPKWHQRWLLVPIAWASSGGISSPGHWNMLEHAETCWNMLEHAGNL